jgi:hypothetical protein
MKTPLFRRNPIEFKEKARHSRESGNPGNLKKAIDPYITIFFNDANCLDARFRGHDELWRGLGGRGEGFRLNSLEHCVWNY